MWTFALFWYQLYNSFDGTYLFDYTYVLFYNLAFTSLPVILMGVLDQDVSDKVSLAVPQLYRRGIERKEWTQLKFWWVCKLLTVKGANVMSCRLYMLDGTYQSLICFYMTYLLFQPGLFVTESGQQVNDTSRMGVYIACATIVVVNVYILLNTYRWDWLMVLLVCISILLIFFWTGVYTAFTRSDTFYKGAPEVYGALTFWATSLLTVIISLLPRFTIKSFQKLFCPRDVDIIREQIRQGKFAYLKQHEAYVPPSAASSAASLESSKSIKPNGKSNAEDDERPIYPPSVAPTGTTRNGRSQNGSDGTEYTGHRESLERPVRPSMDRPRPSFDRMRSSMDKIRPSFEASNDFTSASLLTRLESSHCHSPSRRTNDITADLS